LSGPLARLGEQLAVPAIAAARDLQWLEGEQADLAD
jgi:hypothetical protein